MDRSDPDWTFDDSWQEEERQAQEEPIAFVPCPCCYGLRHEAPVVLGGGGFSCTGRQERVKADMARYLAGRGIEQWEEDEVQCMRCFDTGVVPIGPDGRAE